MSELGQLIMTGVSGTSLTSDEEKFIESENIGGVILFSRNYESPAQLAELINQIQTLRSEYPLFIAVDQEGGRVQRFKSPFSIIPPMYDLARLDSPKIIFHTIKIMAEELKACGVNINLSPVCDIWNNPKNSVIGDRSFGQSVEIVSKNCSAVIRGLQTNGIMSCAKHFPGHGCTTKDSHFDLPYIKKTLEELETEEIIPFVKAAKSRVDFLMMAHLQVDAIDEELPCSLSEKAHRYVREKLRYNGLIISDDMEMKAITDKYSYEEAAVMAVEAGTNIVEYQTMEKAMLGLNGLKEAKRKKEIRNETINERLQRINELKKTKLGEYKPTYIPEISKSIGVKANQVFMNEVAEKISQLK